MPISSGDFVTDFLKLTEYTRSPEIFRKWTGIWLASAAVERRVWLQTGTFTTYPHLYIFLVAVPGVGKGIITTARNLLLDTKRVGEQQGAFFLNPDNMTKASMIDELSKSSRAFRPPGGAQAYTYHTLLIAAEEFQVLLPAYDQEYITVLTSIYNAGREHKETRRYGTAKEIKIPHPQLSLLTGVQPGWMASQFPEEAWTGGLASRIMMIYADKGPTIDPFAVPEDQRLLELDLLDQLEKLASLYGPMTWADEAKEAYRDWYLGGMPPVPQHSKMSAYANRRDQHCIKLSMVSALARQSMTIELGDYERAREWMAEAERLMPDIFRAMAGKSDARVLEELHLFVSNAFRMSGGKPVHERAIWNFLSLHVPADKINRLVETAEKGGLIDRLGGTQDQFKPRPKSQWGVE